MTLVERQRIAAELLSNVTELREQFPQAFRRRQALPARGLLCSGRIRRPFSSINPDYSRGRVVAQAACLCSPNTGWQPVLRPRGALRE
jgi:hypothetical protein